MGGRWELTSRWPLRYQLVVVVALLVVSAIAVVSLTTYQSLQASLHDRIDDRITDALADPPAPEQIGANVRDGARPAPPPQPARRSVTPAGTWVAVLRPDRLDGSPSEPIYERSAGSGDGEIEDRDRPAISLAKLDGLVGTSSTLGAASGDEQFRVGAIRLGGQDVYVVAMPLSEVESTLGRLLQIELVVGAVTALGAVLIALILIRGGLRPLESIAAAAARIADHARAEGGDNRIDERVPVEAAPGTEVGQLSSAINGMLDQIDESLDAQQRAQSRLRRFVADASHELRTPLTSIQGYAELARRRAGIAAEDDDALARIEAEAQHMARLVEDMLLLSRLDEGFPMHPVESDVGLIAATAVDAARVVEPARDIMFETSGDVVAMVDPVRVRQLVDNLLANVRAHAGADASVVVRAALVDGIVRVEVGDSGIGLDESSRLHAMDRFWRADEARGRDSGGSGLGLSIVRSIARSHGGGVELSATGDGRGLTVTVLLGDAQQAHRNGSGSAQVAG